MPFIWAHKKISDNIATWKKKRLECSLNWCSQNDFDYRYRHFSLTGIHENRSFHVPYHKHKICFLDSFSAYTFHRCNFEYRMAILFTIHCKTREKKTRVPVDRKRRVNGKSSTFLHFEWKKTVVHFEWQLRRVLTSMFFFFALHYCWRQHFPEWYQLKKTKKNAILAYSYDTRRLDLNKFSQMFTLRRKVVPSTTHVGFYQHLKYNIDLLLALFLYR